MKHFSAIIAVATLALFTGAPAWAQNQPPDAVDDLLSTEPLLQYYGSRLVGNAANVQNPDIGRLSDLSAVTVWSDTNSIQGRIAEPGNGPLGNIFAVSTETGGTRNHPVVAPLANGEFLVVWEDTGGADGELGAGIRARRMNRQGFALAPSFRVNENVLGEQTNPEVIRLANGELIIAWTNWLQEQGGALDYDVRARRLDASLMPQGVDVVLNDVDAGDQEDVALTALQDGGFVSTWMDGSIVRQRRFNADLTDRGTSSEVVNNAAAQYPARLATLTDGDYLVAWNTSNEIMARRFAPDGSPRAAAFPADADSIPYSSAQVSGGAIAFDVTAMADGGFGFAWRYNQAVFFPPRFFDVRNFIILTRFNSAGQFIRYDSFSGQPEHIRASETGLPGFIYTAGNGVWSGGAPAIITQLMEQHVVPFRTFGHHQLFVTANDSDPDGDPLSITHLNGNPIAPNTWVNLPSGARIQLDSLSFTYDSGSHPSAVSTPLDQPLDDVFTYTLSDGQASDTANVTVRMLGRNEAPTAIDDPIAFGEDSPARNIAAELLANDTDPDTGEAAQLTISTVSNLTGIGTFYAALPAVTYDPAGAFNAMAQGETAQASFTYAVTDPHGAASQLATATITINGANDAPSVGNLTASMGEAGQLDLSAAILALVSDPDTSDTHTITGFNAGSALGGVTLQNGMLVYDPVGAFDHLGDTQSDTDTFTYTISDPHGGTANGTATITINGTGPNMISVALIGLGVGQVGSAPAGIVCGNGLNACMADFAVGSQVTLTASPLAGSRFDGWTGSCAGQGAACQFNVNGRETIRARFETTDIQPASVLLAVLPNARAGSVGGPPITAFATAVSASGTLQGCTFAAPANAPVTFAYQQLTPGNVPTGPMNPTFDIPDRGSAGFVLAMTPNQATGNEGYLFQPQLACENGTADPIEGVNSINLSIGNAPGPDVLSIGTTATGDGILFIPGTGRTGLMVAAAVNIGAGPANMTATADTGSAQLPLTIELCQTDAAGACMAPRAAQVQTSLGTAPSFFAVFARADGAIAFDPANARLFLRFTDGNGVLQSATSVAVTVPASDDSAPALAGRYSVLVRQPDGVWPSLSRADLFVSDEGWAVSNDGVSPRVLELAPGENGHLRIAGMPAIMGRNGMIRVGGVAAGEPGSFWGVRDARSNADSTMSELAGIYGDAVQLTQAGELRGSLGGCQVAGRTLPVPDSAPGLRFVQIQLMSCAEAGEYLGVIDASALVLGASNAGWVAERQ